MKQKDGSPQQPVSPAPRRRFRLMKLEDRIAPQKGGNNTKKCGGSGTSGGFGTLDCTTSY
jgi:hypothetical protein